MTEKTHYKKNNNLFCEKIDDVGIILFDEESRETHILNQSAMFIWELIDEKMAIHDIYDLYCKSINLGEISYDEVQDDFYETISLLEKKNIIQESCKNEQ